MPVDPTKQAYVARDAIEKINHATLNQKQLPAPVISSTVQALLQTVQRLPQGLEQLAWQIRQRQTEDAIRMDDRSDSAAAVRDVDRALADAVHHLDAAAQAIQRAASPLFHMAAK